MENIYNYIHDKGNIPFSLSPLNEADNIAFCILSYLDLSEVIPPPGKGEVRLRDAAHRYFRKHGIPKTSKDDGTSSADALQRLFLRMSAATRYQDMQLSFYVDRLDPDYVKEFSALCIHYQRDHIFIAFRGTSNSLVGWKEDFLLEVTGRCLSQKDAVQYVKAVARKNPGCLLDIGGHSKGGHLAIYAGANVPAQIQEMIRQIWSNDGPDLEQKMRDAEGYRAVANKIRRFVPASSVASMVFPHGEDFTVIKSCAKGLLQHDAKTWIIRDGRFAAQKERAKQSIRAEQRVRSWLSRYSRADQIYYTNIFFDVLFAAGVKTFSDFKSIDGDDIRRALTRMRSLPARDRRWIWRFVILLARTVLMVK